MEVPAWILVILVTSSVVLLAILMICTCTVLQHWYSKRGYSRLNTKSVKKVRFVTGERKMRNVTFIPITYVSTVQSHALPGVPSSPNRLLFRHARIPSSKESYYPMEGPFTETLVQRHPHDGIGKVFEETRKTINDIPSVVNEEDDYYYSPQSHILAKNDASPVFTPKVKKDQDKYISGNNSQSSYDTYLQSPHHLTGLDWTGRSKDFIDNKGSTIESQIYIHSESLNQEEMSFDVNPDSLVNFDREVPSSPVTESKGTLGFSLEYDIQEHILRINIKQAYNLTLNETSDSTVNSYVNICLVPEDFLWKRTELVENSYNPVFNEMFEIHDVLHHKLREYILCLFVMNRTSHLGERVIGKVMYPLSDLRAGSVVDACVELIEFYE